MLKKVLIALMLTTSFAMAQQPQQQPDPAFMQRAIQSLQAQRNAALDAQTVAEARVAGLTEDLNKANLQIKGLQDKYETKAEEKK